MLRQSRTDALSISKADLDKKFNLKQNQNQCFVDLIDETGKPYVEKIMALRDEQRELLPLYIQSKYLVAKHQNCIKTLLRDENSDQIPEQIKNLLAKGEKGLSDYGRLMHSISTILRRNSYLIEQMALYHENMTSINEQSREIQETINRIKGNHLALD